MRNMRNLVFFLQLNETIKAEVPCPSNCGTLSIDPCSNSAENNFLLSFTSNRDVYTSKYEKYSRAGCLPPNRQYNGLKQQA